MSRREYVKTLKEMILESVVEFEDDLTEQQLNEAGITRSKIKIEADGEYASYEEDVVAGKGTYIDNNGISDDGLKLRFSITQHKNKLRYYFAIITTSRGNVLFNYKGEANAKFENFEDNVDSIVDFAAEVAKQILNAGYWVKRATNFRLG